MKMNAEMTLLKNKVDMIESANRKPTMSQPMLSVPVPI